ncbi:MAG: response regulator [Acidimicrobiales bacterium]|nr:response regulator [Hyphomonadaceae bacterium]RZV44504.1 MAG: response regulator [Acidimicrobiales bacterium]
MGKTRKILIVEDDPFIAMDIEEVFLAAGYKVLGPVAVVDAALLLLQNMLPDAATLDFNLGKETSLPIAEELDKLEIPYVFLSGQMEKVVASKLDREPTILAKPFDPDLLMKTIDELTH